MPLQCHLNENVKTSKWILLSTICRARIHSTSKRKINPQKGVKTLSGTVITICKCICHHFRLRYSRLLSFFSLQNQLHDLKESLITSQLLLITDLHHSYCPHLWTCPNGLWWQPGSPPPRSWTDSGRPERSSSGRWWYPWLNANHLCTTVEGRESRLAFTEGLRYL